MTAPRTLLLATTNRHKVGELSGLLIGLNYKVVGLAEIEGLSGMDVDETGATFQENARQKALAYGARAGVLTLAEDSGLCVEALGGGPGIYSARYGHELGANAPRTDAERTAHLLKEMTGQPNRRAWYECALCLVHGADILAECTGKVEGRIAEALAGEGGFGYDPVFIPDGHDRTFAELPASVKAAGSHRANAVAILRGHLEGLAA